MPHIEISALTKIFRRGPEVITPIRNLALKVEAGEVVALIGPSGSGKTTLLNLLAGVDTPDTGHIRVDEDDVADLGPRTRDRWRATHVGLVFQSFHLIDVLDSRQNVLMGLAGRRPGRADRERATQLLERLGLADRVDHRPDQLSGGQQQRVAIARALVHRPKLILADEPTGNLDSRGAGAITRLLIEQARAEAATVIIVTHDHRVADSADRCCLLEDGALRPLTHEEIPA